MATVSAGWSVIGKRPGTYDDYAVLSASSKPFTVGQFEKIVFSNSPGNSPPKNEESVAALPWVWFNASEVRGTRYVGVSIRAWTNEHDATNRPISRTRYFCVALDEFLDARLTFTALYETVRLVELPWEGDETIVGEPMDIEVRPGTGPAPFTGIEPDQAALVAARLLDGPVTLLGGAAGLADRLAVLDSVAALLPAGAKSWLSASSWADFASSHPMQLAFARRARESDQAVDIHGGAGPLPPGGAAEYRRVLGDMCRKFELAKVVEHLATCGDVRNRDTVDATAALLRLDFPTSVVTAARGGGLTVHMLRELHGSGRFGELSAAEQRDVLVARVRIATPRDVVEDADLLAAHWRPELTDELLRLMHTGVASGAWSAGGIAGVARVADRVGARDRVVRALTEHPTTRSVAAALQLAGDDEWAAALAPVIARSDALSIATMRAVLKSSEDMGTWQNRLDAVGPDTAWQRISRPYRLVLGGGNGSISASDLDALDQLDPEAVADLVEVTRTRAPSHIGRLLEPVLSWLRGRLPAGIPARLNHLLLRLPAEEPWQQARIDLILLAEGEVPARNMWLAGQEYHEAIVRFATETALSRVQRERLVEGVTTALPSGWSQEDRYRDILDTLWDFSHPPGQAPVSSPRLLNAIATDIAPRQRLLLRRPELERWLPDLIRDPRLTVPIRLLLLERLPENTQPARVAREFANLILENVPHTEILGAISASRWHPPASGWAEFLSVLTARLHTRQFPDTRSLISYLARYLMEGGHGGEIVADLPGAVLPQLYLAVDVLLAAGQAGGRQGPDTRYLARQLTDMLRQLEGAEAEGSWLSGVTKWRKGPPRPERQPYDR